VVNVEEFGSFSNGPAIKRRGSLIARYRRQFSQVHLRRVVRSVRRKRHHL
jgi:hypothetical protein